jgi:hypothetical protein
MVSIEEEYNIVNCFDDLLKINIKYLNGIYDETCYRYGEIRYGLLSQIPKIKILNRLGFYTINFEPSKQYISWINHNNVNKNSPTYKEGISDGYWCCLQERGYIEGLFESKHTQMLIEHLQYYSEFYYIIEHKDGKIISNIDSTTIDAQNSTFKKDRLYLSRETFISGQSLCYEYGNDYPNLLNKLFNSCIQKAYWKNGLTSISCEKGRRKEIVEFHEEYENILDVLVNTSSLTLITKDYNSKLSLEDLLIDFFTNDV